MKILLISLYILAIFICIYVTYTFVRMRKDHAISSVRNLSTYICTGIWCCIGVAFILFKTNDKWTIPLMIIIIFINAFNCSGISKQYVYHGNRRFPLNKMDKIVINDTKKSTSINLHYEQGIHVGDIKFRKEAYSDIQNMLASHNL